MIILRPIELADLDVVYTWRNDPSITEHLARLEATRDTINQWYASLGADKRAYAIVVDDVLLGYAEIDDIDRMNKKCNIGVVIGNMQYWSRGIGTKAARAVTEIAFRELGMHRALAVASERNLASIRCFNRAGYTEEGRLRHANFRDGEFFDLVLLSVLEHEWVYSDLASREQQGGAFVL
jgi:RimJ/RimL family protein N-acetyltransferase